MTTQNLIRNDFAIERLLRSGAFQHHVNSLELLETHISWIVLTGKYAYKIKKPVNFDFVDYSTLERRKAFCEMEVALNRRFAPELYLGVVPIFDWEGEVRVGEVNQKKTCDCRRSKCDPQPIEYAVKMRQFPQDAIVAARMHHGELTLESIENLGTLVAEFHETIECALPTLTTGSGSYILADARANIAALKIAFAGDRRQASIERLQVWTMQQYEKLPFQFERRLKEGMVRRCHGDLHLKNIIQLDGRLVPFDGIEFNDSFQWIDVLSEIAFPVMDFVARGRSDLGWRLLNAYLESTGDYEGLSVLRFYLVYRSMVRAKVTWLNPKNKTDDVRMKHSKDSASVDPLAGPWDKYLDAAEYFACSLKPSLTITHGLSGSGKSYRAMQDIDKTGGVRIRSDSERNRLACKFRTQEKYSREMSERVYSRLLDLSRTTIESGLPVIVDATFLKRQQRADFAKLAIDLGVPFGILDCDAPKEELRRRIEQRGADPSEATVDVLTMQINKQEPLTDHELEFVVGNDV